MSDTYGQPPTQPPSGQPGGLTQEDRTWALASHVGTLVSAWFAFGFLAPLLVMLLKNDSAFVRRHAVESLNFQISLLIYGVVGTVVGLVLTFATFGIGLFVIIPVVAILALVVLVLIIVATVRASNGEDYRYPFTLRFIS
jgi:uncharacterized Tic20 family protein